MGVGVHGRALKGVVWNFLCLASVCLVPTLSKVWRVTKSAASASWMPAWEVLGVRDLGVKSAFYSAGRSVLWMESVLHERRGVCDTCDFATEARNALGL